MLKNIFLLFTILLFSGCAEHGYQLTNKANTHTFTAKSRVNLSNTNVTPHMEVHKMQEAINKERKLKQKIKVRQKKKELSNKDTITEVKTRKEALKAKQLANHEISKEEKKLLEEKRQEAIRLQKEKVEESAQKSRLLEEQKVKFSQLLKEKELAALKAKKILAEQKILEMKRTLAAKKAKATVASTEALKFQLINKIYHKFGSSEVHGHVIYLDPAGQETRLAGSKVYLLPVSATLNNWYENYYLQNKDNPNTNYTVANYLNSTYLNLEKNFKFYGIAEGSYYVIIESNYPLYIAKNKKVYIAKKIKVGKYKKIMAVFSKKL